MQAAVVDRVTGYFCSLVCFFGPSYGIDSDQYLTTLTFVSTFHGKKEKDERKTVSLRRLEREEKLSKLERKERDRDRDRQLQTDRQTDRYRFKNGSEGEVDRKKENLWMSLREKGITYI